MLCSCSVFVWITAYWVRFDLDILPKFQKLSRSSTAWPVQTSPWLSSKRNMALQLPARLSEIARSSQQRACQSSLTYTEVARGSLLSHPPPPVMLLLTGSLQLQRVCVDSVRFDLDILPKFRKLSRSSTAWSVQTSPWLLSECNMRSRPAARRIVLSSEMPAGRSSLTCTSLQHSHVARGSLLSHASPHGMLLCKQTLLCAAVYLASLDPYILSKLRTLWLVQTSPWPLSECNMRSPLAAWSSEIVPSSDMLACRSSLTCTSLQHSHVARGSLPSQLLPQVMLLLTDALQLQRVCVDTAYWVRFDLDILPKFQKLSRSSTAWPVQTSPWLSSKRNMALQLPARLSAIVPVEGQRGRFGSVNLVGC